MSRLPVIVLLTRHTTDRAKHRVAVAIRPRILSIAMRMQLVVDGGQPVSDNPSSDENDDSDGYYCDCEALSDDFPCWDCVRTGRRTLSD